MHLFFQGAMIYDSPSWERVRQALDQECSVGTILKGYFFRREQDAPLIIAEKRILSAVQEGLERRYRVHCHRERGKILVIDGLAYHITIQEGRLHQPRKEEERNNARYSIRSPLFRYQPDLEDDVVFLLAKCFESVGKSARIEAVQKKKRISA